MKNLYLFGAILNVVILISNVIHGAGVLILAFNLLCAYACWYAYDNR